MRPRRRSSTRVRIIAALDEIRHPPKHGLTTLFKDEPKW